MLQYGVTTEVTVPAGIKMDNNGKLCMGRLKAEVVSFSGGGYTRPLFPWWISSQDIVVLEDGLKLLGCFACSFNKYVCRI
jgi:hypothetical protein